MIVNEIFGSIDGEGLRTGELATFVRLAGCNLRCSYCDTDYALTIKDGKEMSVDEILCAVKEIGYKNITLTGGEPLIHNVKELVEKLCLAGYNVNIETNGSVAIGDYTLYSNVLLTMDYKLESSGASSKMRLENLNSLRETDVLKFVTEKGDFEQIKQILKNNKIKSYVYISPVFGKVEPCEIVEFIKELHDEGVDTDKIRAQVQLHKIIWKPETRGV